MEYIGKDTVRKRRGRIVTRRLTFSQKTLGVFRYSENLLDVYFFVPGYNLGNNSDFDYTENL
jgi:hypothetical protein